MDGMAYTLYELNHIVREAIEMSLTDTFWLEAEIADVHDRTHCYMDLVQNDAFSRTLVAKARANCWANKWMGIKRRFEKVAGQPLRSGIKVLMQVTPTFHEAYGFAYQIVDIDLSYTLGDMARRRQEIVRQLKEEGVFDLQRELPLPLFAQRIAVVSSETAAGYGDFCRQLMENEYGLAFSIRLFPAIMQGEQVEQSVIAALNEINRCIDDFDVVVIIRGGGATADMSGFDTLPLAENVANFPLPIITGIGHDRDECVLDMVSHTRVKTPTAAATFLVDHLCEVQWRITEAQGRLTELAKRRLEYEKIRLSRLSEHLPALFSLTKERQMAALNSVWQRITVAANRRMDRERHRLTMAQQAVTALDPALLLKRGYTITIFEGKAVKNPKLLKIGDVLETRMEKGTVKSVVTK